MLTSTPLFDLPAGTALVCLFWRVRSLVARAVLHG